MKCPPLPFAVGQIVMIEMHSNYDFIFNCRWQGVIERCTAGSVAIRNDAGSMKLAILKEVMDDSAKADGFIESAQLDQMMTFQLQPEGSAAVLRRVVDGVDKILGASVFNEMMAERISLRFVVKRLPG